MNRVTAYNAGCSVIAVIITVVVVAGILLFSLWIVQAGG